MISIVLALPTKKVFYFFKYRDIANAFVHFLISFIISITM